MALGTKVTVKKVTGHPRGYKWRANFIEEGKRRQKYFKKKTEADDWAEGRREESLKHGTSTSLSAKERAALIETREKLKAVDWDVRAAIEFAARAKSELAPFDVTPETALAFAVDYFRRADKSITVRALAEEIVDAKKSAGRSKRHEKDLRSKLNRFAETFGDRAVATLERREIEDWLHGLKLSLGSVNSYRRIRCWHSTIRSSGATAQRTPPQILIA